MSWKERGGRGEGGWCLGRNRFRNVLKLMWFWIELGMWVDVDVRLEYWSVMMSFVKRRDCKVLGNDFVSVGRVSSE